jgi:RNA polymerase sigma-70 factor (ECF subfamily)
MCRPAAPSAPAVRPSDSGRGDAGEAALAALWSRHAGAVRAYALRLTGDWGAAEDIAQETFLRAWRSLHRLDPNRSPLPWLLVVARNAACDRGRRRASRAPETLVDDWSGTDTGVGGGIDELLDDVVVAEALGRVSKEHRAVLECVFLHGLGVAEAAERLGLPPGTVKSRTYYGLRAMRLALDELGYRK